MPTDKEDQKQSEDTKDQSQPEAIYPYGETGPTQTEIDELKAKHGDLQLVNLAERFWIYRQMKREEHLKLVDQGLLDLDSDSLVVSTLLVWPDPEEIAWDNLPAGLVPTLSADMLVFSGFVPTQPPVTL